MTSPIDPLDHRPLIRSIAWRYRGIGYGRGLDHNDMNQEGFIGLMHACESYDESRGVTFGTHATRQIKYAILGAAFNQARPIRIPPYQRKRIRKGADPDAPGLSRSRRASLKAAMRVMESERADLEIDVPLDHLVGPDPEPDEPSEVLALLGLLTPRERTILTMRFGLDGSEPLRRPAIGKALGLTRERIRQIEVGALAKLRDAIKSEGTFPA